MRGVWRRLDALLVFVPAAIATKALGAPDSAVFVASIIAVIPLASLIGRTTEALAERTSGSIGALLNATFGNATELVLGIFLIAHGDISILKASITGAIVGNLLLVLGISMVAGGWRRREQELNRISVDTQATMLVVAVATYIVPSVYAQRSGSSGTNVSHLSYGLALVLVVLYAAALFFTLVTHRSTFRSRLDSNPLARTPAWSVRAAVVILGLSTAAVAVVSDFVAKSIETAGADLGLTTGFLGFVVVPVVGNATEHYSAVLFAARNRLDVASDIAIGSSMQLIMFVVPAFVFAGWAFGNHVTLVFGTLELVVLAASALLVRHVVHDARANWLEGAQLLGLYLVFALAAYYTKVP